ncbi:MAG TPA: response regulator transcription factor [Candidatus Ventricola gallistercoris]|nr:response regulator transcription factor [Candidatus Ventricola gallistercoris]
MKKILIADDNLQITKVLSEFAKKEGFEPVVAQDGDTALSLFQSDTYAVLLLDVMMPGMDGFSLCREIRRTSNVPIIMITARSEDYERIMGLDIGADDYIVKPFSGGEVMARVRAILRRVENGAAPGSKARTITIDTLTISLDDATVTLNGQPIALTRKELEILYTLAENRGKLFSRDTLLSLLWGYDYYGDNRTVDSHVKRLRAKLDVLPHPTWQIKTIWGMGYKLEVASHES